MLIPIDKPLKHRMKLRKSDNQGCWANFKYEGVPTFCYICGIIGHSEKFCEKIFETPPELIEKPYGSWMRAEPRRRNHTIGSKWLRYGGVSQATETMDGKGKDNVYPLIGAGEVQKHGNSGIVITELGNNQLTQTGAVSGIIKSVNIAGTVNEEEKTPTEKQVNAGNDFENNGLLIMDPKRRRTEVATGPSDAEMADSQTSTQQNQKNEKRAGAALQARLEL